MGAVAFLLLFLVGVLLATVGGVIGIIDAFRVSPVWGLLSLLIPFALLVFCIKFWSQRKWARNSLIATLAGLASMLVALPFLGPVIQEQIARRDDSLPMEDVPLDGVPIPLPDDTIDDEEFVEPLVPAAPQLAAIARADLIQSTDPDERVQQITSSRTDPFATVPVPPPPQVTPPPPTPTAPTAVGPGAPGAAPQQPTPAPGAPAPGVTAPTTPAPGVTPPTATAPGAPAPPATPPRAPGEAAPPLAPLPDLPTATFAQEVTVTGVINIGGENFAIVQSPDESTSRYVRVGQRLANGVLVKRIDTRGSDPVVVLEENGIEVSRPVGAA
ncbi:MAG: hypothetical protein EA342_08835 [Leptolyngbya sp. LCM1.Bin17]|nr:MAG: hypothetical protein EA342_08835 [Leptolyngbya sp. LCM1.Bin17]